MSLAQKNYYPDFRVGYDYWQRPDLPDMHGFNVGINVPIFYKKKQREEVRETTSVVESGNTDPGSDPHGSALSGAGTVPSGESVG